LKRKKKMRGLNEIFTVTVRVGEADDPSGRNVRWKAEKEVDLILNNFGILLAGLIRPVPAVTTGKSVTMKDTSGIDRTVYVYQSTGVSPYYFNTGLAGTRIGVGSSSQAAARTDYNLITQLGSWASTGDGVWTSATGKITFSGSVYLSEGGTVREVGFLGYFQYSGGIGGFLLFRDVISDVAIGAGKYAFVQYTINL